MASPMSYSTLNQTSSIKFSGTKGKITDNQSYSFGNGVVLLIVSLQSTLLSLEQDALEKKMVHGDIVGNNLVYVVNKYSLVI